MLAEMAILAPFLITVIFGIIEFSWLFSQHLDVRHGARETSRLMAVNYDPDGTSGDAQAQAIIAAACERMDVSNGQTVTMEPVASGNLGTRRGAFARASVSAQVEQLTGFFAPVLDGVTLSSTVETRLEQKATWADGSNGYSATGTCT